MVASNPNAVQEIQMAVQEIQMAVQEIQMQMVKIIAQKELKQAFDKRIDLELALAKSTNEVAILKNDLKEAAAAKQGEDGGAEGGGSSQAKGG